MDQWGSPSLNWKGSFSVQHKKPGKRIYTTFLFFSHRRFNEVDQHKVAHTSSVLLSPSKNRKSVLCINSIPEKKSFSKQILGYSGTDSRSYEAFPYSVIIFWFIVPLEGKPLSKSHCFLFPFPLKTAMHLAPFFSSSILISFCIPVEQKQPHSMIVPSPYTTLG